ncbi:hypothetical protein F2Q69_00059136 [Brassica cretica]|uniref:Uncharacterized protein n=1 Tax=Brassica cretica TaxID=69181 RepID=A0A8S9RQT9_BRACR|nr:hypothetical protein F2Q69_00059136 [Brassica cretica]
MVATLILEQDENGYLHDQEGHLHNAVEDDFWQVVKEEKLQEGDFDVESSMSFGGSQWCRPTPIDENRSMEWDEQRSTLDVQHRSTSQLHHARRNPSQPSETSTYNISEQSEDAPEPMQVDQATVGRTLRKRMEKVLKHLKRGTNDKEMKSFRKRILRIPLDKPFEEAYFTGKL